MKRATYAKPICPNCGIEMKLCNSNSITHKDGSFIKFWLCEFGCDIRINAHPNGRPVGIPVDKETRQIRRETHELLKELRRRKGWTAKNLYFWIAEVMHKDVKVAHVGYFNANQCLKLQKRIRQKIHVH